jgi:hypothetical protein
MMKLLYVWHTFFIYKSISDYIINRIIIERIKIIDDMFLDYELPSFHDSIS